MSLICGLPDIGGTRTATRACWSSVDHISVHLPVNRRGWDVNAHVKGNHYELKIGRDGLVWFSILPFKLGCLQCRQALCIFGGTNIVAVNWIKVNWIHVNVSKHLYQWKWPRRKKIESISPPHVMYISYSKSLWSKVMSVLRLQGKSSILCTH